MMGNRIASKITMTVTPMTTWMSDFPLRIVDLKRAQCRTDDIQWRFTYESTETELCAST